MSDEARVGAIRARCDKATPGPWAVYEEELRRNTLGDSTLRSDSASPIERTVVTGYHHPQLHGPVPIVNIGSTPFFAREEEMLFPGGTHFLLTEPEDAAFIAHSRTDIPWLLAERDAALARVERLEAALDGLVADMQDFARVYHGMTHPDHSGTWLSCDRGVCGGMRRALTRALTRARDTARAALVEEGLVGES